MRMHSDFQLQWDRRNPLFLQCCDHQSLACFWCLLLITVWVDFHVMHFANFEDRPSLYVVWSLEISNTRERTKILLKVFAVLFPPENIQWHGFVYLTSWRHHRCRHVYTSVSQLTRWQNYSRVSVSGRHVYTVVVLICCCLGSNYIRTNTHFNSHPPARRLMEVTRTKNWVLVEFYLWWYCQGSKPCQNSQNARAVKTNRLSDILPEKEQADFYFRICFRPTYIRHSRVDLLLPRWSIKTKLQITFDSYRHTYTLVVLICCRHGGV